jgi:hypothetical protein
MTFALQPMISSDGHSRPDDYYIVHEGETVGRICRINSVAERWCWTLIGPPGPTDGPNGGVAESLDEAKAAFRAAWERSTQAPQDRDPALSASRSGARKKRIISAIWADKLAIALLGFSAVVAAILAVTLFAYPTITETLGAAIGLFVSMAALFVLPLWLILRVGVWLVRTFRPKAPDDYPPRLDARG